MGIDPVTATLIGSVITAGGAYVNSRNQRKQVAAANVQNRHDIAAAEARARQQAALQRAQSLEDAKRQRQQSLADARRRRQQSLNDAARQRRQSLADAARHNRLQQQFVRQQPQRQAALNAADIQSRVIAGKKHGLSPLASLGAATHAAPVNVNFASPSTYGPNTYGANTYGANTYGYDPLVPGRDQIAPSVSGALLSALGSGISSVIETKNRQDSALRSAQITHQRLANDQARLQLAKSRMGLMARQMEVRSRTAVAQHEAGEDYGTDENPYPLFVHAVTPDGVRVMVPNPDVLDTEYNNKFLLGLSGYYSGYNWYRRQGSRDPSSPPRDWLDTLRDHWPDNFSGW